MIARLTEMLYRLRAAGKRGGAALPNRRPHSAKPLHMGADFATLVPAMKELPHTRSCFVCGESNPFGLKLRFHDDGTRVQAKFTPGADHVGFKSVTHGGLLATVLDEIMVWACAVRTKRFAYCAEMTIRFLRPVAPGTELTAIGELAEDRRGRMFHARGRLIDASGAVVVSSMGKYLPIKDADTRVMKEDFVGDASGLFDQ